MDEIVPDGSVRASDNFENMAASEVGSTKLTG